MCPQLYYTHCFGLNGAIAGITSKLRLNMEKRDAVMEEMLRGGIIEQGVDVSIQCWSHSRSSTALTATQCSLSFRVLTTKPKHHSGR